MMHKTTTHIAPIAIILGTPLTPPRGRDGRFLPTAHAGREGAMRALLGLAGIEDYAQRAQACLASAPGEAYEAALDRWVEVWA